MIVRLGIFPYPNCPIEAGRCNLGGRDESGGFDACKRCQSKSSQIRNFQCPRNMGTLKMDILVPFHNLLDVWPPALDDADVAIVCPDLFHIRSNPSYEPERIRSFPTATSLSPQVLDNELLDRTSTQLTQSSCSKLASNNGGIKLRTYCRFNDVSEDNPFVVRYSSRVVRKKVPLIRKLKGIGDGVSSMDSELRICERPYRRTSAQCM